MSFRKNIILILIVFIIGFFCGSTYKENKTDKELAKEILKEKEFESLKSSIKVNQEIIDVLNKSNLENAEEIAKRNQAISLKVLELVKNWDSYSPKEIKEELLKMTSCSID